MSYSKNLKLLNILVFSACIAELLIGCSTQPVKSKQQTKQGNQNLVSKNNINKVNSTNKISNASHVSPAKVVPPNTSHVSPAKVVPPNTSQVSNAKVMPPNTSQVSNAKVMQPSAASQESNTKVVVQPSNAINVPHAKAVLQPNQLVANSANNNNIQLRSGYPEAVHSTFVNIGKNRFYVGVSGGMWLDAFTYPTFYVSGTDNPSLVLSPNNKLSGFAGSLFTGYNFDNYFGAEASYTYLAHGTANSTFIYKNDTIQPINTANKITANFNIIDVTGVVKLPVNKQFNLFTKLGPALVLSNSSTSFDSTTVGVDISPASSDRIYFDVVFGLGATYDLSNNIVLSAQYKNYGLFGLFPDYLADSNDGGYPPLTKTMLNTFNLGIAYKF